MATHSARMEACSSGNEAEDFAGLELAAEVIRQQEGDFGPPREHRLANADSALL
ncbi:MAG: hypothetical protein WBW69_16340 [Candidatus Korobacteraceae bacterium]